MRSRSSSLEAQTAPPPLLLGKKARMMEECSAPPEDSAMSPITSVAPPESPIWPDFDPLLFMASVPSRDHFSAQISEILRQGTLEQRSPLDQRPCLVLDLDETLVHSSTEPIEGADYAFPVEAQGTSFTVYAKVRPYCREFLRAASAKFELVIYTASKKCYADTLLDLLDPSGDLLSQRLFREHCVVFRGNFLKDLELLNRPMARTVIVDNSPPAFAFQVDNGIPIESFFGTKDQKNDEELLGLLGLLDHLADLHDVRPFLQSHFRLKSIILNRRACY